MSSNERLSFEKARYNGVVTVIADQIKQISNLEKKYKLLQSEHNILKRTYLNLLDGHLEIIDGKNKTIKRLRLKVKKLLFRVVKDLKDLWLSEACNCCSFEDKINKLKKKWEK